MLHIAHNSLLCLSLLWFRFQCITAMLETKAERKTSNYVSLTIVPDTSEQRLVLAPVLLTPNSAEVSSAACLSSPHPLAIVVLYSTSSLSTEAAFLLATFCIIYFPFKLRTFIFLSFLLACLHPLQNCLISSSSIPYLYNWGMSSVSSFYVFTISLFRCNKSKTEWKWLPLNICSTNKCVWNVFPCHENSVLTMLLPGGLLIQQ